MESSALHSAGVECVALRYGFFYGPGTWYASEGDMGDQLRQRQVPVIGSGQGVWSFVHIEDAAAATVAALGCASGAYNVVDGDPVPQRVWLLAFARTAVAPEQPCSKKRRPWPHSVAIPSTMRRACAARRTRKPNASCIFDRARWSGFTVRIVTT